MNLMETTYHFGKNARKRVSNLLEKNGNTYKKARVEKKVNVWREKKVVSRERNKIQKIIGIDLTAKVQGKVRYNLKTSDKPNLMIELQERGILFDSTKGIRYLSNLLKKHLRDMYDNQKVGEVKEVFDEKFFSPISGVQWNDWKQSKK